MNVYFSSRIKMLSREDFARLPVVRDGSMRHYADGDWHIGDRVRNQPYGFTRDARICQAGGFQNGERLTLFHLLPSQLFRNLEGVYRSLVGDWEELKSSNQEIRGFLTGGKPGDEDSRQAFSRLKTIFSHMDIPCSFVWGQKATDTLDTAYSVAEDTWYVTIHPPTRMVANMTETLDDVGRMFEHVYIAPGDTLEVGNEKVVGPWSPKEGKQS